MSQKTKNNIRQLLEKDKDMVKEVVQMVLQEILEQEANDHVGALPYQRTDKRKTYRSGYYNRTLTTRVGKLELRIPQTRDGSFSTELFERYQRSEQALVLAIMQMYVQGVSTRKVKAITEELCGHAFSASTVSRLNKNLDARLTAFAQRKLEDDYAYLILDARYERVRENHVVKRRAVLVAIGIGSDGRRHILGVEVANRESRTTWKGFLQGLVERGLRGVELVVSDNHEGLKQATFEVLPGAYWQRCYVHFLRNAKDHIGRRDPGECLTELRWLYERRDAQEARQDLAAWLAKWSSKYGKLCDWVEENIEETLTFYRLPRGHHKHMRSTNLLERFNQELKRRTHIVRIFPDAESCWRLVVALSAEQHEEWQEGSKYLDMKLLHEHKRELMRTVGEVA